MKWVSLRGITPRRNTLLGSQHWLLWQHTNWQLTTTEGRNTRSWNRAVSLQWPRACISTLLGSPDWLLWYSYSRSIRGWVSVPPWGSDGVFFIFIFNFIIIILFYFYVYFYYHYYFFIFFKEWTETFFIFHWKIVFGLYPLFVEEP